MQPHQTPIARLLACVTVLLVYLAAPAAADRASASSRHLRAALASAAVVDGGRQLQQQFADIIGSGTSSSSTPQLLQPAARRLLQQQPLPPGSSKQASACAVLQALRSQPQAGTFVSLVNTCGLEGTLCDRAGRAGVTLLAPSDTAVAEYLVRRKLSLSALSASKALARSILLYHIVPDPRLQQLAASAAAGTEPQVVVLQTAAATSPSELVAKTSSGVGLLLVDARGRAGKVLRVLTPAGAGGPQVLLVDRVLSHTYDPLGMPAGPAGMAGVRSVEESGSPRMNGRASIAHAKGAVGVSRHDGILQQQLQQP